MNIKRLIRPFKPQIEKNTSSSKTSEFANIISSVPEIIVLEGVSNEFVLKRKEDIANFSMNFLKELKQEGFSIILAPTLEKAYKYKGVVDQQVLSQEKINPSGTLGSTYFRRNPRNAFIVFADKPSISDKNGSAIVNHELSHGIEFIKDLRNNCQFLDVLRTDIQEIKKKKKLDNLSEDERKLLNYYFFQGNIEKPVLEIIKDMPVNELIADMIAWKQKGGGCYGSGLTGNVYNPDLLPNLFPNVSNFITTLK